MSGVHPYWLVYLHWIGAVPAIVFLGCLLLRAVARLTAPAA
jgi:hypothetical protein